MLFSPTKIWEGKQEADIDLSARIDRQHCSSIVLQRILHTVHTTRNRKSCKVGRGFLSLMRLVATFFVH